RRLDDLLRHLAGLGDPGLPLGRHLAVLDLPELDERLARRRRDDPLHLQAPAHVFAASTIASTVPWSSSTTTSKTGRPSPSMLSRCCSIWIATASGAGGPPGVNGSRIWLRLRRRRVLMAPPRRAPRPVRARSRRRSRPARSR